MVLLETWDKSKAPGYQVMWLKTISMYLLEMQERILYLSIFPLGLTKKMKMLQVLSPMLSVISADSGEEAQPRHDQSLL